MSKLQANESYVKTVISTKCHTFCWEVQNISKLPLDTFITSPTFKPSFNHEFQATLGRKKDFTWDLKFRKISGSNIESTHKVFLMNNAGKILREEFNKEKYVGTQSIDVIPSIGLSSVMFEAINSLPGDVLIFKCVMEFDTIETDINHYKFLTRSESPSDDQSVLSKDLQAMYDTSVHADISLKVGDSIVRVHKSVMCARSSVFARMFETPMQEHEKNVVNITDLDLPVLKDLVSYLYTGVLAKDDFESVHALYYAADKYNVPSLRKTCVDVLLSKMDVANASRVLVLADHHSDMEFKNSVFHFIKFLFDKVLKTDAWNDLVKSAPRLATEVISAWGENRKNLVKTDKT